jgi:hypothetical protein
MPEQPSESLHEALDQIERLRKRYLLITRIMVYPCVVFLAMSVLFLLFHPNKWLGMAYGIISLFGMIGASALSIADAGNANTQRILKAIELSSRANSAREH